MRSLKVVLYGEPVTEMLFRTAFQALYFSHANPPPRNINPVKSDIVRIGFRGEGHLASC